MQPLPQEDIETGWPELMAELVQGERFLVWSFRRWVLGLTENDGAHWNVVWREFDVRMEQPDGPLALANLAKLIRALQLHARRQIQHHHPCCPCLGADEAWLVNLVGACQHRQGDLAQRLAAWMVVPEASDGLIQAGSRLAYLMLRHELHLPYRTRTPATGTWETQHAMAAGPLH